MPDKELEQARFLRQALRYRRLLQHISARSAYYRTVNTLLQEVDAGLLSPTAATNALPTESAGAWAE